jgi:hypothetical protein
MAEREILRSVAENRGKNLADGQPARVNSWLYETYTKHLASALDET